MTLGALTAKLGAEVIRDNESLPYEVELNGQPVESLAVDHEHGIVRMYTRPYDKRKYADDGIHGRPDLNREDRQYVLFG